MAIYKCIGGPLDQKVMETNRALRHGEAYRFPRPRTTESFKLKRPGDIVEPEPIEHDEYIAETLTLKNIKVTFLRHHRLPVENIILRVFAP